MNLTIFFKKNNTIFNSQDFFKITLISTLFAIYSFIVPYIFIQNLGVRRHFEVSGSSFFYDLYSFIPFLFFIAVITPIFEEFIYRFPLNLKTKQQAILSVLFLINIISAFVFNGKASIIPVIITLLLFSFTLFFFWRNKFLDLGSNKFNKTILILSVISFSLSHLGRYNIFDSYRNFALAVTLVLLQYLPISLYLSYLRMRYNDGYVVSVLAHGLINFIPLISIYITFNI